MTVLQKTSLLFILFVVISWNIVDLSSYFNLSFINTNIDILQSYVHESPKTAALLFFTTYILIASFSLPGATILTILSGSIFSYPAAVIIVSFASSIGATCAFAISKILFKDWTRRFSIRWSLINSFSFLFIILISCRITRRSYFLLWLLKLL